MKNQNITKVFMFILLSFTISCKEKSNECKNDNYTDDSLDFTFIEINPKKSKKKDKVTSLSSLSQLPTYFRLSNFSNSIEYIPLETSDTVLVGRIDKIIKHDDKIFILDKLTKNIFCFSFINGKFLYKINKQGDGPGEYLSIEDFDINENGDIVIYSPSQGLFFYNQNGFLKRIDSSIIASNIHVDDDTVYYHIGRLPNGQLFNDFPKQYRFIKTIGNEVVNRYLPSEYEEYYLQIPTASNSIYTLGDTVNLIDYLNQEIYHIVNNRIKGKYKFKFKTNKHTFNYGNNESINKKIFEKIKTGDYTGLSSFLESENYIFINYSIENLILSLYITKCDYSIYNVGLFYYDDFNNIAFGGTMISISGDKLISTIEPDILLNLTQRDDISDNLKKTQKRISPSDNPIIIIMNLK